MSEYENKLKSDGTENPKYVDMLDEDKAIANQKFVCMSFVSPDKILKQKNLFLFEEFVKKWDLSKSIDKFGAFLQFIAYKYNLKPDDVTKDLQDFIEEEKDQLGKLSISDDYKNFLDNNEEKLENKFSAENNFQTSVNGVKVRGVYPTQDEAEFRAKKLREVDPNFDVYVGPVGVWMPWEPEAYKTGRVEYLEDELNQLMHKKKENEDQATDYFNKRIKETKQKAIEENVKLAKETGNKLTQNINEKGELVGVNTLNTQEEILNSKEEVSSADIKKELFEGDNIVIDKDTDHGLSLLTENNITLSLDSSNKPLDNINEEDEGVDESKKSD